MKTHLPIALLALIMGSYVAQSAPQIPSKYEQVPVYSIDDWGSWYQDLADTDYVAFLMNESISITPLKYNYWAKGAPIITGGNVIITSQNASQSFSISDGPTYAFYNFKQLDISSLDNLTFENNLNATSIYTSVDGAKITVSKIKGDILFSDNYRGIGNSAGTVTFSRNEGTIVFEQKEATATLGAIVANDITFNQNTGDIKFNNIYSEGYTNSSYSHGAIKASNSVTFDNNSGDIIFHNNTASEVFSYYNAGGGAISMYGGNSGNKIIISNNSGKIEFSDNIADQDSFGGAIYCYTLLINNNSGDIIFSRNGVKDDASQSHARGGAIYCGVGGSGISIVGNNSVIFEKNYEIASGGYRLRSIDCAYGSGGLNLAAKTGGFITFYDSVYTQSGSILNGDYEDANGVIQKAMGDIIFSGKYTEAHLKEVKGAAGTASEIANSRTSTLASVSLCGGTLRVEDKAILNTYTIDVTAGSNATLRISDGEVNSGSRNVTVNATGTLELTGTNGSSKLTAKNVYIEEGATLSVGRLVDPSEVITLAKAESVNIYNEKLGGVASGNLNMQAGSTYKADGAHLSVLNGTLTFNSTAEEKINLVLTLQERYDKDSQVILFTDVNTVKFVLDNITTSKTGQVVILNAADYFTGDWVNENTSLVYDKGTIYVSGVNRVVPEPTTATLSLLALMGLVARRRRK